MKIISASDSFKGSLSQQKINQILFKTAKKVFGDFKMVELLISDGGEGALDALISYKKGKILQAEVSDPLFRKINARYGVFEDTAVISMSEASGITLVNGDEKNPYYTTTYGTGELIKKVVLDGYKKVYVTIGGSATNDGGLGVMSALGYKVYKKDGTLCKGVGKELIDVEKIDCSDSLDTSAVEFIVLSDVTNPLTGEKGASKVFAKQKGATPEMIEELEKGMKNWASVLDKTFNVKTQEIIGGGAAGGLGAMLYAVLSSKMRSGIEEMLNLSGFDEALKDADFVITGEGRIDGQSLDGKVISGIVNRAKRQGVPVYAIVGSVGENADKLYEKGLDGIYSIINKPDSLENVLNNSEKLYSACAESLFRTIKSIKK